MGAPIPGRCDSDPGRRLCLSGDRALCPDTCQCSGSECGLEDSGHDRECVLLSAWPGRVRRGVTPWPRAAPPCEVRRDPAALAVPRGALARVLQRNSRGNVHIRTDTCV